jgi:hypothetical protein
VSEYRIVPAGDSALIVEFEERIDPAVNARAIACGDTIQAANLAGVRDVVPTYRSVAIYFDPLRTDSAAMMACVHRAATQAVPELTAARAPVRIPVCYGGGLGPDLAGVAAFADCRRTTSSACTRRRLIACSCSPVPGWVTGSSTGDCDAAPLDAARARRPVPWHRPVQTGGNPESAGRLAVDQARR